MENLSLTDYLLIAAGIWFALLNFYLVKTIAQYRRLTRGASQLNLDQILASLGKKLDLDEKRISQLLQEVAGFEKQNLLNFQKFALVRFNPFEETGGDQSFVAALLDGQNTGIVISSLHSRNGTRVYAKPVANALSTTHEFSKEEKEVVEKAARQV
ncbi:DUF4446 family protein [Candidatus Curtissbacteria bacterium]|nr:DUF4446 family protein [Candidatus Curtissbacteria bacterium]